jgi:hypothetical protein
MFFHESEPEEGSGELLQNIYKYLPIDIESYPERLKYLMNIFKF